MLEVEATFFKNRYDTSTSKKFFGTIDSFEDMLEQYSKKPYESKNAASLISPAVYDTGSKRCNDKVLHWGGWAAVDIDNIGEMSFYEVGKHLQETIGQYRNVIYSTASSTKKNPKFRIVFFTTERVPSDKIRDFWYALSLEVNLGVDPQCKDLSRMYYTPGSFKDSFKFFHKQPGSLMVYEDLLKKHAKAILEHRKNTTKNSLENFPEEIRKAILKHRVQQMNNYDVEWSNYKDCPFTPHSLIKDYDAIAYTDGTGRYLMIYKIMTAIASKAIKKRYPITPDDIVRLIREIDSDRSNLYSRRPLKKEAQRAISYAYSIANF